MHSALPSPGAFGKSAAIARLFLAGSDRFIGSKYPAAVFSQSSLLKRIEIIVSVGCVWLF